MMTYAAEERNRYGKKPRFVVFLMALLLFVGQSLRADHGPDSSAEASAAEPPHGPECDYGTCLFGDWAGLKPTLEQAGIGVALSCNSTYQVNVHGGRDTEDANRGTGYYDLEVSLDLGHILGLEGGRIYTLTEGGFGDGLDGADKIGDLFGVNANAIGHRSIDLIETWYEQALLDGKLMIRTGKIDLTGGFECKGCPVSFDGNSYANDETSQFMNGGFVNNPTIPFADNGLGLVVHYNPVDWLYASLGAADAQADVRETGFNTAFHGEDYFTYLFEFGAVPEFKSSTGPLVGAYRFGLWYDPQPKEIYLNDLGGRRRPRYRRDDVGFYLSFDQMILRESTESDQGLGLFFRYGFAHGEVNEIEHFWSLGGQYKGLINGRDDDVLGLGVAQGMISDEVRHIAERAGRETVFELYYNIQIAKGLAISPDVQVILDPGGRDDNRNAVVLGIRLQMNF
jgi:porin